MNTEPNRLLAAHTVLRTGDVAEFHAYIAGMEGGHTRHVVDTGPLEIELRHAFLGRLDVGLHYASVRMTVVAARRRSDCYLVQFPLSGGIELEVNHREFSVLPGSAAVLSPSQQVRRTGLPGWTLVIRAPGAHMRAHLEARLGRALRGDVTFHPRISTGAAELLSFALLIVEAIDRGAAPAGSSVATVLEDGFLSLLVDLQPHSHGTRLSQSDVAARSARIRTLANHIDRHLDEPLTVGHLARVAGCSPRSLQATFNELCGLSPMAYVQQRRLTAARALLQTEGAAARVSDIAWRTGFSHLARFAARYKARYGESPSETRRRAASQRASGRGGHADAEQPERGRAI